MSNSQLLNELVLEYYSTRPNLDVVHPPLCVFFFACSGAGKSTLRKLIAEQLNATYVCNDEVRLLLEKHPEASKQGIELKHIVAGTVKKIFAEANNKLVIYDNIIIQYYMHPDSYLNVAKANGLPVFIIGLPVSQEELEERVKNRGVNVAQILSELPGQLLAYDKATKDIVPDWTIKNTRDSGELQALTDRLETTVY